MLNRFCRSFSFGASLPAAAASRPLGPLSWLRQWLTNFEITDGATAHLICRLIPAQCPFEREVALFGRTLVRIPPLCKLNPLYTEVVGLRFRALCYLADCCGEDVGQYC